MERTFLDHELVLLALVHAFNLLFDFLLLFYHRNQRITILLMWQRLWHILLIGRLMCCATSDGMVGGRTGRSLVGVGKKTCGVFVLGFCAIVFRKAVCFWVYFFDCFAGCIDLNELSGRHHFWLLIKKLFHLFAAAHCRTGVVYTNFFNCFWTRHFAQLQFALAFWFGQRDDSKWVKLKVLAPVRER